MRKEYLPVYIKTIIFAVIVIIIIVAGINFLKNQYEEEKCETIKTNMLSIEGKTKIIGQKVKIKEKDATYIGKKIEELLEDEDIKFLQEKEIIDIENKDNKYYVLEQSDLDFMELSSIKVESGYYIVEYNNNDIFYSKGIKNKEGVLKYKLSELKEEKQEEIQEENTENVQEENKQVENKKK